MNLNFNEENLVLIYLQIKLKEQYNPNILVTGDYYTYNTNNYGFAHFIAKYLNAMYPPLDAYSYSENLDDSEFDKQRELTDTISIMNYFLCDNKGNKLTNDLMGDSIGISTNSEDSSIFQQIYGKEICSIFNIYDPPLMSSYDKLVETDSNGSYKIKSDYLNSLSNRILITDSVKRIDSIANSERIYYMSEWSTNKEICEIDNLVLSYLLGRTITPNSSMEDIYYVQKLFYGEYINSKDKGIWNSGAGNLTDTIIEYQRTHVNSMMTNPLFVTGYFDIFTEASVLRDRGETTYGIHGL